MEQQEIAFYEEETERIKETLKSFMDIQINKNNNKHFFCTLKLPRFGNFSIMHIKITFCLQELAVVKHRKTFALEVSYHKNYVSVWQNSGNLLDRPSTKIPQEILTNASDKI